MSIIENYISGNLYNELFSKRSEECTVFQSMAWFLIVHNILLSCSPSIFLPVSLFLSFISFFMKSRILLQFLNQAFIILPEQKVFLKILQISQESTCVGGCRPSGLINMWLQHSNFLCEICEILRIPVL